MKATLQQILGQHPENGVIIVSPALVKLASLDLPMKTAYWLKRIAKAAEGEARQAEEMRVHLVKKYGEQQGEGWKVKDESGEAFKAEYADLLDSEVDLPGDPIPLDNLGDVKLSALDLMRLDWLIIDGEGDSSTAAARGAGA